MAGIGPYCVKLFKKAVEQKPKHWGRTIKGILSLTKLYSNQTIEALCRRALFYGAIEYRVVKNICKNSAYVLPLEKATL